MKLNEIGIFLCWIFLFVTEKCAFSFVILCKWFQNEIIRFALNFTRLFSVEMKTYHLKQKTTFYMKSWVIMTNCIYAKSLN